MPFIQHQNRNILFVHIPRTGGTTVEHWMRQHGELRLFTFGVPSFSKVTPQHYRYADIAELLGDNYFDYAFTIVRNPFDRLASEYKLRAKLAADSFWGGLPKFPAWLESQLEALQKNPFTQDNHLRPQWDFVSDKVKIFKYEDGLENIFKAVATDLNIPPPENIEHRLSTAGIKAEVIYDIPQVERLNICYKSDFDIFNYNSRPPL